MTNRAVFLDRDGTINAMVYNPDFGLVDSPANPDEFCLLPGVCEAIRMINEMGLLAVVVSNQPGIAKGKFTPSLLEAMTDKMHRELDKADARLDAIYYCLHHPQAVLEEYRVECDCRKPKPGLLKQAKQNLDIDLVNSFLIGDGITDIAAGRSSGICTFLVGSRKPYIIEELFRQRIQPDYLVSTLAEAVQVIQDIESGNGDRIFPYVFKSFAVFD